MSSSVCCFRWFILFTALRGGRTALRRRRSTRTSTRSRVAVVGCVCRFPICVAERARGNTSTEALAIEREVYAREKKLRGPTEKRTLLCGNNLVHTLVLSGQYAEAKTLSRKLMSQCRRALGSNHEFTMSCRANFAEALYSDARASRADILQAVTLIEDVVRYNRRVLGKHHPDTVETLTDLERARMRREDVAALEE